MKNTRTEEELKDREVAILKEIFINCTELAACYKASGMTDKDADVKSLVDRAKVYRRQLKTLGVTVS